MTETPASDAQLRKLFAVFNELGITERDERLAYFQRILHGSLSTSKDLRQDEASRLIDQLEAEALFSDPARMLEAAETMKQLRKRDLLSALSGRRPAGETLASDGSFDGGARPVLPAEPETPSETVIRLLRSGEAKNVGHRP